MKLRFTKMQGAGNDFVMINGIAQHVNLSPAQYRLLADRRFGIGADQILLVQAPENQGVDFRYRIFNADGGEVEQCGNGARCFVKFVHAQGLTNKRLIRVETLSGIIVPELQNDGEVTVDMGAPIFDPVRVPFNVSGLSARREHKTLQWPLRSDESEHAERDPVVHWVTVLSMGNPHAVQIVADVDAAPVTEAGPRIEHHARFAQRVNAGWMQVVDRHTIRLRVWERGAGETLACGTGACAAVVAGVQLGKLDSPVAVHVRGGRLRIAWNGSDTPVLMTGPAQTVFEGEVDL